MRAQVSATRETGSGTVSVMTPVCGVLAERLIMIDVC
jgi:hypothetical protein